MTKVKMLILNIEERETSIEIEDIEKIKTNVYRLFINEDNGHTCGILKKPIPSMGLEKYDVIEIFGLLPEVKQKWSRIYYNLANLSEDAKEREEYQKLYKWVRGLPTLS